jgi:hypothetical protein
MKDFVGNELAVGDEIVAIVSHGRNAGGSFSRGRITRLTDSNVFFDGPDYAGYDFRNRKVHPSKVLRLA